MEMNLTGLKTVLKKFDRKWSGSYSFGNWRIAQGGYDCWFELYYRNQPVLQCIAGELSCNNPFLFLSETDKEKLLNKVMEVLNHPDLFVQKESVDIPVTDDRDFEMDDIGEKRTPAANLPEGWEWVDYDDGSGSLRAPDGKHYFSYDLHTSYTPMGGIEYQETNDWTAFYGSLSDFKTHAENVVTEKYLPEKAQSLGEQIAEAAGLKHEAEPIPQERLDIAR